MHEIIRVLALGSRAGSALLIENELRKAGCEFCLDSVITSTQFEEYLQEKIAPHLIFLDLMDIKSSGREALATARKMVPTTPVILFADPADEERAIEGLKQGAVDYLLPGQSARLSHAIKGALERGRIWLSQASGAAKKDVNEGRYEVMANLAPVLIWVTGTDKYLHYFNQGWLNFTGRRMAQEFDAGWIESIHPDDRAVCLANYAAAFDARQKFRVEYRLRRADGEYRWILDSGVPRFSENSEFIGYIGSCIDITDRMTLESQVRHAQKMESIGRLAAGVAHDFNNILTVIRGHSGILLSNPNLPPDIADSLRQISNAAIGAGNLTRQLLTLSRRQKMEPQILDLNEVVSNLIKMLKRVIGEDVVLQFNGAHDLSPIYADPGMIEQVLMNLTVNARDAMPRGGVLTIGTAPFESDVFYTRLHPDARAGSFVRLSITDTGCGMDSATISRIFEPFFTTKEDGHGTGLGLATVYGIVKQHHGWIEVDSQVGKGTSFRVYFPIKRDEPRTGRDQENQPNLRGGTETILVVEDEPPVRELARSVLNRFGYKVLEAESGVDALDVWSKKKDQIDLLLTDMVMPNGCSGRELAEKLVVEKTGLKVLYMSGYSPELADHSMQALRALHFLPKPFNTLRLVQAVRECLDK